MPQPNELRIFISSTFRDLQEEREHLIKKIFPEIRSLCRARGIRFTEVDLRWGLTDEDVGLGRVIRTCLEEVDKCRPYFIGITGDRYGFIPSFIDIQKDPSLLEQYPWIEDAAMDEMSITEMEAQYGVLSGSMKEEGRRKKEETDRARFYFRRHRASLEEAADNDGEGTRLAAYQERIRVAGVQVEQFRDAGSLGELIYDDLIAIIKRDFADAKPPTPLETERARHEAFSLSRRRAYIANPVYLKRLNEHAAADGPPLVVYAESGSGKSSLFAYWAEQYRRKNPDAHVIEHYVGIGATATDHYAIIRHVCMEINERFGRNDAIPSDPANLEAALGQWLGYADHEMRKRDRAKGRQSEGRREESQSTGTASDSSLIIILDGLNQLQGTALNLKWIPDVISPSIRLILSSTVEGTLVELKKRGWLQFGMQALSEAEREAVVVRYLAEYHKSLNPDQIKRIASDYKCGHPLFLKTLLEELRLVGRHEDLERRIEEYLSATGTEDLFQRMLERMEEDHGARAVRESLLLLWASRSGLEEVEVSELTGSSRLKMTTLVAGLDYHLVRKEGRLTFFHDYLRRAVEKRYLSDEQKQRTTHLQLAEYFQSVVTASISGGKSVPLRVASELAYQLHAGGAMDRLRECLSTMPVFLVLFDGETRYEVLGYWSELGEETDVGELYRRGLEQWTMEDDGERSIGMGKVADLLERLGRWSGAIELSRERLHAAVRREDRSQAADAHLGIGWLLYLRGEYPEALQELSQSLDLYAALGDRRGVARAHGNMGPVYSLRGEHDRALENLERSLEISEELGDRRESFRALGNIGAAYFRCGEYDRALGHYRRVLLICEELGDRSGIAKVVGSMGLVYGDRNEQDRALECYQRCLSISEEVGDRQDIARVIGNMGRVYSDRGEYDRALASFQRQLNICEELGDRYGASTATANMGIVYDRRGEYDLALESYERTLRICEELGDRRGMAAAIGSMGFVYCSRREYDRALASIDQSLGLSRELANRYDLGTVLYSMATVLLDIVVAADEAPLNGRMPAYLPKYIPEATEQTWRAMSLVRAQECAEECVAISEEIQTPDLLFAGRVLLARITAIKGNAERGVERLRTMLAEAAAPTPSAEDGGHPFGGGEEQRAELHYWLWEIEGGTDNRAEALRLYTTLLEQTPKHEFKKRIAELSGPTDAGMRDEG